MSSIIDALERAAAAHPDRQLYAFLDGYGRETDGYTYRAFRERTRGLASHLALAGGLRRGDRVLLVYPPGLELVAALCACARIGVIPAPVPPPTPMSFASGLARLALVARDCEPKAVLTTLGVANRRSDSVGGDAAPPPGLVWITTDQVRDTAADGFRDDPGDVLLLQYTSGSTTEPKGVVVSHDNVIHNCAGTLDFVPICVSWLPQYHDMGLIGYYLYPLITGGTTFGFSPGDFLKRPALWLETITRVQASHTGAPNFGYDYCLREDKLPDEALEHLDLSSLRIMMNAAEPVRPVTHRRFLARFAPCGLREEALIAAYGLAENTIAVSQHGRRAVTVNKKLLQKNVLHVEVTRATNNNQLEVMSCGRPIAGVAVAIVDADSGHPVGHDRVGEIWISGPSVCGSYWNRPAPTAEVFGTKGHLRTGDLGFFHDGELFVCGRIKDLIIVRGVNHYPQDIEAIVESCSDKIRPGCTAAFDAGDGGEQLVVAIEVKRPKDLPDAAAIARAIRARYFIAPHTIVFVPHRALPKTTSGKLARGLAARRWREGRLPILATYVPSCDKEPADRPSGARDRFRYLLETYDLGGDEHASFAQIGIDSLTTVELLADLKKLLEQHGAAALVDEIDVRFLSRLTIAEFFAMLDRLERGEDRTGVELRRTLSRIAEEQRTREWECMRLDAVLPVAPIASPTDAPRAMTDILMTGATGFFGPFLLSSLLRETPFTVHVLTRASSRVHGMERIRAALDRAGVLAGAVADGLERRVRVACGDLTRHELGLGHGDWDRLAGTVQAVVHNGACVNYVLGYDALRPHNVDGTRELIRFAFTRVRKAFHFVSSTFIFGWTAKDLLREDDDNDGMENLDFGYAQSKWVAERLVHGARTQGLDARVYRPSLISASSLGIGSRDDVAVRLLAFMIAHGLAPDARNQISFLPADLAAHNIAAIVARPEPGERTLHVTVDAHYTMVDVARRITSAYGYPFAYLPIPEFVAAMNRLAGRQDPIFPLLDFFNRSHHKIATMQHKRYANDAYRNARERSGRGRADPHLHETVDYLMAFLLREGMIPRGQGTLPFFLQKQ